MEFQDIGRVWREETGEFRRTRVEDLSAALGPAARFNAKVRNGMARAAKIGAIPLVLTFLYLAVEASTPLAAAGAVIMAVFALVVVLWYGAISRHAPDSTLPVRLAIQSEVERLRVLERFFANAGWVFALYAVGFILYTLGPVLETADRRVQIAAMSFFVGLLGIFALWTSARRRRARRKVRSLQADLESWLGSLEGFDLEDEVMATSTAVPKRR